MFGTSFKRRGYCLLNYLMVSTLAKTEAGLSAPPYQNYLELAEGILERRSMTFMTASAC